MIRARALPGQGRAALLASAVLLAALVRDQAGGRNPAASVPAAGLFVVMLVIAWLAADGRPARPWWRGVALGCGAGAVLAAVALHGAPHAAAAATPVGVLLWWAPLVTVIAIAEELVLRGVLFDAVRAHGGDAAAVAVSATLFALIHLPLYGLPALGVDLAAGVVLGALRVLTGGVTAPAAAHAFADLLGGWLA